MSDIELTFDSAIDQVIQKRIDTFLTKTLPKLNPLPYYFYADVLREADAVHIRPYPGGMNQLRNSGGSFYKVILHSEEKVVPVDEVFFVQVLPEEILFHRFELKPQLKPRR
jgi:hypothetical protein